jgi:protein TonB
MWDTAPFPSIGTIAPGVAAALASPSAGEIDMKLASALACLALACLALAGCAAGKTVPVAASQPEVATARAAPSACPAAARLNIDVQLPAPGFVPAAPRGATLVLPRRLRADMAQYPSASLPCREQGRVGVTFCVNAEGRVDNAQIVSSSGFARLDNAVLAWLQSDRYTPGTINGASRRYCGLHSEHEFELEREQPEHAAAALHAG